MNNRSYQSYQEEAQIELILAARIGNLDGAIRALKSSAVVNAPLPDANIKLREPYHLSEADRTSSALHIAVTYGHVDMIKLLLNHEANPNLLCNGKSPFITAIEAQNIDIASLLLEHKADVNQLDRERKSAYVISALNNNDELCSLLLNHGAKRITLEQHIRKEIRDSLYPSLHYANIDTLDGICNFLIANFPRHSALIYSELTRDNILRKCFLAAKDTSRCRALLRLIDLFKESSQSFDTAALLPEKYTFANLNLKEDIFASIQKLPLQERIKKYNAILNHPDSSYYRIFHMKRGYIWGVNEKRGILHDIREAYDNDITLNKRLLTAIDTNDISAMRACLEEGADTEITTNKYNATALIFAINASNLHIVQSLLNHHAKIDTFGNSRMNFISSLHFAIYEGRQDILELLIDHMIKHYDIDRIVKFLQTHDNMKRCFKLAGTNSALLAPLQMLLSHLTAHNVPSDAIDALLPENMKTSDKGLEATPETTSAVSYPRIKQENVQHPDAMQKYLNKGRQLRTEAAPPAYVVENPFTEAPLPQTQAAPVGDPFAAIDTILMAPAIPKKPSWIEGLNEIDFSGSSTAVIMNQLGDLISFEEPAKPCGTPFDDWIEQPAPPIVAKPGYTNPFDQLLEQEKEDAFATQLAALPKPPTGGVFFAVKTKSESNAEGASQKRVAVPN